MPYWLIIGIKACLIYFVGIPLATIAVGLVLGTLLTVAVLVSNASR